MREIKFRVWDDHYKYMNYKVLVGIYGEWEKVKDDKYDMVKAKLESSLGSFD